MHSFTRAFISFLTLTLTLTTATSPTLKECRSDRPCFLVHNFEKAKGHDGISYELDITFPNDVNITFISTADSSSPTSSWTIVPAIPEPIHCPGLMNVPSWYRPQDKPYDMCESVNGTNNPSIHTKFNYHTSFLYVKYVYYGVAAGRPQKFVYTGMRGALNGPAQQTYRDFDLPAVGGPAPIS